MSDGVVVKVENLYKEIEGRKILKGVSFEVREREIFSIIGGSGSGKTSITKHIIGLWKPTSGRVLVFGKEVDKLSLEKLRLVDLDEDVMDLMPSELSGGMRKRVSIARAIATNPKLIIYDEPTSGLDPITSRVIDKLVLQLRERTGTTAIVVTHDMISAFTISDRLMVVKKGDIIAMGEPDEVLESKDPFIQEFIGDMRDCLSKK